MTEKMCIERQAQIINVNVCDKVDGDQDGSESRRQWYQYNFFHSGKQ